MPLEALKHVEVDYWTDKAGPGPKHEQEELVAIHGVPRDVMETIRKTNDHELIATYIYPFIDFWNLVEHHILIWIACIFFSGTLCIVQPILVACESSKITRLFNDNYMFRIYRAGLTIQVFQAFLLGQFDMDGLVAICIVTIIVIIWEDLPLSTEDWIHCYGIPVVVQYGPFPEHVCILFPKQDPYRPYHTMSLAQDYIELDRWARLIIEVARKIVAAAPPPPEGHARQDYMVKLRQVIVEEAVQLGLYKGLEDSKRKLRAKDYAFRHHSMSSYHKASKAASDAVGGPDKSRLVREKAGIRAVEV